MTAIPPPTHYEILGLSLPVNDEPDPPAPALRAAYRRALLRWHPDKSDKNGTTLKSSASAERNPKGAAKEAFYSVDQISTAYSVLSNAREKMEYDKELKTARLLSGSGGGDKMFKIGVEVVDLDDLEFDYTNGLWYRGCRCGDERGFEVREQDLEDAGDEGEVVAGCRGCSLWLRVLFGVVDESVEGEGIQVAAAGK